MCTSSWIILCALDRPIPVASTTGSYLIPFVLGAVVAVIAGIAYLLLLRAPIRVDSAATEIGDTSS